MTRVTPRATADAATPATACDLCATARGQIEFSLNLLRIASPGVPTGEHPSDGSSARAHITALEELLASIDLADPVVDTLVRPIGQPP